MSHHQKVAAETSLGDLARGVLDDLLIPLGFQSGQGGSGERGDRDQVIFCAPPETLDEHFPRLDLVRDQVPDGGCVDLVIEGSLADGISRVDFESFDLSELLRGLGRNSEAESVEGWPRGTVREDLERVRAAMAALMGLPA
jgi:hypothetical protein